MEEDKLYIYGKNRKYRATRIICKGCGKELLIFRYRPHCGYCQSCNCKRLNDNTRINENELYLIEAGAKRRAKKINCLKCKKELIVRKNSKQKFCITCNAYNAGMKNYTTGINSHRKTSIKIYGDKCCFCNLTGLNRLDSHHIDGDRTNNKPSNLALLCKSCHLLIHGSVRKGLSYLEAFEKIKGEKMKKKTLNKTHPKMKDFLKELESRCAFNKGEGKLTWECDHNFNKSIEILKKYKDIDVKSTIKYFEKKSCFCDCEIILNLI